jgi:protein-L-isoaspartate O-methyltransferase
MQKPAPSLHDQLDLRPNQSVELLKALHIITREGKINQDSRRKLKQVNHLLQFMQPLIEATLSERGKVSVVDHGAGKSYLGFMLYDRFLKSLDKPHSVYGVETREELVARARELARDAKFDQMKFVHVSAKDAATSSELPETVDIVTALHACDTATDDAISFALSKKSKYVVLVPCCQAEVAAFYREEKSVAKTAGSLSELWKHPIQAREFGAHITNVLRGLRLEANGYKVTVTELVGWEHSMKNELIVAEYRGKKSDAIARRDMLLTSLGLESLAARYQ